MRTIEIDDDVYFYLLGRTTDGGVTFSDLMRRAFGLERTVPAGRARRTASTTSGSAFSAFAARHEGAPPSDVERWLKSPRFLMETTSLGRFMCLLSFLQEKHGEDFACVLDLSGRKRRYFALSAGELEETGTSVFPKVVPGSPFWVVTNTETAKKRQIVESVMRMLGYGGADIRIAGSAI